MRQRRVDRALHDARPVALPDVRAIRQAQRQVDVAGPARGLAHRARVERIERDVRTHGCVLRRVSAGNDRPLAALAQVFGGRIADLAAADDQVKGLGSGGGVQGVHASIMTAMNPPWNHRKDMSVIHI